MMDQDALQEFRDILSDYDCDMHMPLAYFLKRVLDMRNFPEKTVDYLGSREPDMDMMWRIVELVIKEWA
jgi:hypothetical protein